MNYKIISYILGWVINIEGACMLLPFLCGIIYSETSKWAFLICSLSVPKQIRTYLFLRSRTSARCEVICPIVPQARSD